MFSPFFLSVCVLYRFLLFCNDLYFCYFVFTAVGQGHLLREAQDRAGQSGIAIRKPMEALRCPTG
jgi:hypothetical protein